MFPVILNPKHVKFMLVGKGELATKRRAQLEDAGSTPAIFEDSLPADNDIQNAHIVYIVDVPEETAKDLAARCRALGVLVNVEDVIPLCDFHTPSIVRRGDLLFSISTNGKSPGLARRLRKYLSALFSEEWAQRLETLAGARNQWRAEGLEMHEVAQKTDEHIDAQGWLS